MRGFEPQHLRCQGGNHTLKLPSKASASLSSTWFRCMKRVGQARRIAYRNKVCCAKEASLVPENAKLLLGLHLRNIILPVACS